MRLSLAALLAISTMVTQAGTITNDFTASDGGFTAATTSGSNWVHVPGLFWKTAADGANYANITRTELTSPTFTATGGNISVSFTHFGAMEGAWDGGVVAYSLNGGATTYVPNAAFTANGYNFSQSFDTGVDAFLGNPVGLGTVFSGTFSSGTSSANLGSFAAGDQVRILFRFGSDDGGAGLGWRLTGFSINGVDAPSTGVPEPATLSLLGAGALVLALRRRK